jgi:hypothetical protein
MTDEDPGYWRFCDIVEQTRVTTPTIATPPETERVVLEQHTVTGEYRTRPLQNVAREARSEE